MADTQTANQWRQAAASAQSNLGPALNELASREAAADQAEARAQALESASLVSVFQAQYPNFDRRNPTSPGYAEWQAARAESNAAAAEAETAAQAVRQQRNSIVAIQREIRVANQEAERADGSPPGTVANPITSTVPPPVDVNVPPPGEEPPVSFQDDDLPADDPSLGELGINTDLTTPVTEDIALDDPSLGELGINTNQITDAALGEVGINPDYPPPPTDEDPGLRVSPDTDAFSFVPPNEEDEDEYEDTNSGVGEARSSGNTERFEPLADPIDYRVKISLHRNCPYLYQAPGIEDTQKVSNPNILYPLFRTKGVIFPYTPQIQMQYVATYSPTDLIHSNYKIYNYTSSSVEQISIVADFTAQDVEEANYVLAVIHFFRSVTKMFYGQDMNKGVPPPLVYLSGHGEYAFNNHAMVISSFNFTWPNDVDYINAGPYYNLAPVLNTSQGTGQATNPRQARLNSSGLQPGGIQPPPIFGVPTNIITNVTRVPTKIQVNIGAYPVVTRDNISNNFSLSKYSTGQLLKGNVIPGGGVW